MADSTCLMMFAASFSLKNCSLEILSNNSPPVQSLQNVMRFLVETRRPVEKEKFSGDVLTQ